MLMKKVIFTFLFMASALFVKAQTVNDIPLSEIDVEYVQIVGTSKLLSSKLTVEIDFGQKTKFFSLGTETVIKDTNGKPLDFFSMIDALNFMSKNGYEFVNAYAINNTTKNQNQYYYLLRNKKLSQPK